MKSYYSFLTPPIVRSKCLDYNYKNPMLTTCDSPQVLKNAIFQIGRCFQREFRYDFPPYCSLEKNEDETWIFHDYTDDLRPFSGVRRERIYGAVGFGFCKHRNGWAMTWAWIHPFHRQRGELSRAIPELKDRYGNFYVDPPLSAGMAKFVEKHKLLI